MSGSGEGRRDGGIRPVVYYPTLSDPRFISVVLLLGLDAYALATPAFHRSPAQWAAGVAGWVGVDALLLLFYRRLLLVPLSAFVPSLAAFVLVDSPRVWPYAAVGAAAMLSKHFVRVDGRHVFNPLNLGLVAALLFLGSTVAFDASRFGHSPRLFLWVGALGVLVSARCRMLDVAFAYVAAFVLGAWARGALSGVGFATAAASATNVVFYMYSFHMMTDPKTTPETRPRRIAFGVLVGVLDAVLRWFGVLNAMLYALFAVSALLPFFRLGERRPAGSFVWRLRARRLAPERQVAPMGLAARRSTDPPAR